MNRSSFGAVFAACLGAVAGAVAGCNFIVGASDYSVEDDASILQTESGSDGGGKPRDAGKDDNRKKEEAGQQEGSSEASADAGEIGDPCSDDAGCAVGFCNGVWCQTVCASLKDTSCGKDSVGETNYCVGTSDAGYNCFPGCATSADCTRYSVTIGTTCEPISAGTSGLICSAPYGEVGDPCSNTNTIWSVNSPCLEADDAGSVETCNGSWCTASCASPSDTSCGSSSTGQPNFCVSTSDLDGGYSCFPGCTTYPDCAPYVGTFCEPTFVVHAGPVCAASGGGIGDPCTSDLDCTRGGGTCLGSWCSMPCSSNSDCGTNAEGMTNYCIMDTDVDVKADRCFPGCDPANGNADCTPYPPSKVSLAFPTCQTLTTESVCGF